MHVPFLHEFAALYGCQQVVLTGNTRDLIRAGYLEFLTQYMRIHRKKEALSYVRGFCAHIKQTTTPSDVEVTRDRYALVMMCIFICIMLIRRKHMMSGGSDCIGTECLLHPSWRA